jgi:glutamate formiminotransferase/formiminotetrahydrofolate cyclodeaminase
MAGADLEATRVPLETAEACLEVIDRATQAVREGNPNAASDAGVAGLLAAAAARGALLNVQINLKSLPEGADKEEVHKRLQRLTAAVTQQSDRCQEAVQAVLHA